MSVSMAVKEIPDEGLFQNSSVLTVKFKFPISGTFIPFFSSPKSVLSHFEETNTITKKQLTQLSIFFLCEVKMKH